MKYYKSKFLLLDSKQKKFRSAFKAIFIKKVESKSMLENTHLMVCQECYNYKMRIKQQRDSGNMFIACTGYPSCKAVINLPKGLTGVLMLD